MSYLENSVIPYPELQKINEFVEVYTPILNNAEVSKDTKALLIPQVGKFMNMLSLNN